MTENGTVYQTRKTLLAGMLEGQSNFQLQSIPTTFTSHRWGNGEPTTAMINNPRIEKKSVIGPWGLGQDLHY